jgi:FkbH-like protein
MTNDKYLAAEPIRRHVTVAATFTAEPVKESLDFWIAELDLPVSVEFAPYGQVFQQLLDPGSQLARNHDGVNVLLIRLEDWMRSRRESERLEDLKGYFEQSAAELVDAAKEAAARTTAPLIVGLCPDSPAARGNAEVTRIATRIEQRITTELESVPNLYLLRDNDFDLYPVADYHDPGRDDLGHIPYTPLFFTALGTILARKVNALVSPPRKVVVLDCDNTLWKGVVGEEGVDGITIPAAHLALQQFMADLARQGFLLCLCSKNDEADVLAVFDRRSDMILQRDDLVSWRINWRSKSENIRSLANELKLGVDSFIFLDDNPLECAEVRAGCPEALTLRLPVDGNIEEFLRHVWAFDRLRATSEDRQRTTMYQQEADRARFQKEAPTIGEFLAGLDLCVAISKPAPEQIERIAQLTQRTNQFNFTTIRRNEGEIRQLAESGLEYRGVEVKDRFGDYGLVGAMIFRVRGDALEIDTFLLSCRVLGRGVEHAMLSELGEIAVRRQVSLVSATLMPTLKNQPARDFLEGVAALFRREQNGGWRYEIPANVAATVTYCAGKARHIGGRATEARAPAFPVDAAALISRDSGKYERFATELFRPQHVLDTIRGRTGRRRGRPDLGRPLTAPRTKVEAELTGIWSELLHLESVGIDDNYFDLGGTSLLAVDLFARIEKLLGKKLPLSSLIEAPTIERLASLVIGTAARDSLELIRAGGDRPPLFLVHDGDGETMLYRNLAMDLSSDHRVYGLRPHSRPDTPMAHTRIAEMATFHIDKMRSVQPHGPYLIGGMCAGGVIAFEIARQLQDRGEKVGLVALIDAADAKAQLKTWRSVSRRLHSFSSALLPDQSARLDRLVVLATTKAIRKAKNLGTYLLEHQFKAFRSYIRVRLARFYLDRGQSLPVSLQQISVREVYLFAEKNYRPAGPFDGDLLLFRATCGEGDDEPYVQRYEDPSLGWGRRATRGVRVFDVPGGHSSILQEPNVRVLADQLQLVIDEVITARPPASRNCTKDPASARSNGRHDAGQRRPADDESRRSDSDGSRQLVRDSQSQPRAKTAIVGDLIGFSP